MNILFVADPLEIFKPYKDSTFSMMREAQRRGHGVAACEPAHLSWRTGACTRSPERQVRCRGSQAATRWPRRCASRIIEKVVSL